MDINRSISYREPRLMGGELHNTKTIERGKP